MKLQHVLEHEHWGSIVEQLVEALAAFYESSVPEPELWPNYKECWNDPGRILSTSIAGFHFYIENQFMHSGDTELIVAVVSRTHARESLPVKRKRRKSQGVTKQPIITLEWNTKLRNNHACFAGYQRTKLWCVDFLDMELLGLLPVILEEVLTQSEVKKGFVKEDRQRQDDILDALAELSAKIMQEGVPK